jgi:hypothetical protein
LEGLGYFPKSRKWSGNPFPLLAAMCFVQKIPVFDKERDKRKHRFLRFINYFYFIKLFFEN